MIPLCRGCNWTGEEVVAYEMEPSQRPRITPCPSPSPTLLDPDGQPVHADLDGLERWCRTHRLKINTLDDPAFCAWGESMFASLTCDIGWATVQTWQEA